MEQARLAAWLLRELGQELRAMAPVLGLDPEDLIDAFNAGLRDHPID